VTICGTCHQQRKDTVHGVKTFRKGQGGDRVGLTEIPILDGFVPTASGQDGVGTIHPTDFFDRCIVLGDLGRLPCGDIKELGELVCSAGNKLGSILNRSCNNKKKERVRRGKGFFFFASARQIIRLSAAPRLC